VGSREASSALPAEGHASRLQQWWLDRSVRAKGLIVIAVPLIAFVGAMSANLVLQHHQHQARDVAQATTNLTFAADLLLADAVNAETGIRGYAATGDSAFLAPYNLALSRLAAERESLRAAAATEGDSGQQRVVNATTGREFAELAQLRSAISGGVPAADLRTELLHGKTTMNLLRAQVGSLTAGPAALLAPQLAAISSLETTTDVLDIAALLLGLFCGLLGGALFTSGVSRRVVVAAANADRLGKGEPLQPARGAGDELGQLHSALVRADELLAGWDAQKVKARLLLLAAIVDSSDDAIYSKDIDGLITSWNPAAERIYGYSPEEIIGQPIAVLLEAGMLAEGAEILSSFVRGQGGNDGVSSLQAESVQQRKDGTTFPVSVTLSAVNDDEGSLIGTSSIARDVTEQHRVAAELRRGAAELTDRMEDLERANRNLETFTYSVSHDLRAPLRALSGFSTALLDEYGDKLDETGRGYAGRIDAAAERMALLIDDLLHLSRLWRTEIQGVKEVDLSAEVTAIAAELQRAAPDRAGRFDIQAGVCAPADPVLIRTVLQNLLENAWKFTGKRDKALIAFGTTPTAGPGICCYVRDNGAGFDPEYVSKLFQPFKRLHPMREFAGTGVGLASVRQIVERHGGRAWAEGAVDAGATFYFTLDVQETE
jgi:PAS domain S-box-containing protein